MRSLADVFLDHWVGEFANFFDLDGHAVAGLQENRWGAGEADAVGCSGEDDGAGVEDGACGQKLDKGWDIENHVVGVPVLHDLAVEDGADGKVVGVRDLVGGDKNRAQWAEGGKGFATAPLAAPAVTLPVASADIVGAGVAQHMIEGIFFADIVAGFSDHHGQFAFVVDGITIQLAWQDDRVARVLQGARILEEQHRIFGDSLFAFLGVLAVIEADAEDIAGLERGEEFFDLEGFVGVGLLAEQIPFEAGDPAVEVLFAPMNIATRFEPNNLHDPLPPHPGCIQETSGLLTECVREHNNKVASLFLSLWNGGFCPGNILLTGKCGRGLRTGHFAVFHGLGVCENGWHALFGPVLGTLFPS